MDEDTAYHFILGSFITLLAFNQFYPGTQITFLVTWAVVLLAFVYLLKGFMVAAFGGEYDTFWAGCTIALMLIIFFNGLPMFLALANKILGMFGAAISPW